MTEKTTTDPRERLMQAERELLNAIYAADAHADKHSEMLEAARAVKENGGSTRELEGWFDLMEMMTVAIEGISLTTKVTEARRRYFDLRNTIESFLGRAEQVGTRER